MKKVTKLKIRNYTAVF